MTNSETAVEQVSKEQLQAISDERLTELLENHRDAPRGIGAYLSSNDEFVSILTELQSLRALLSLACVPLIESMSDEEFDRDRSDENPNVGKPEMAKEVGETEAWHWLRNTAENICLKLESETATVTIFDQCELRTALEAVATHPAPRSPPAPVVDEGMRATLERIAAIKYPNTDTIYAHRAAIDYARDQAKAALEGRS